MSIFKRNSSYICFIEPHLIFLQSLKTVSYFVNSFILVWPNGFFGAFSMQFLQLIKFYCHYLNRNRFFSFIFSGMAWNFRFSTLSKKQLEPIMVLPRLPHFEIAAWLEMLELTQYNGTVTIQFTEYTIHWKWLCPDLKHIPYLQCIAESFSKFIGVEELMYICESDIKQLGVRNSAHRARIVSSLVAFRDKYEHGTLNKVTVIAILHVFMPIIVYIMFFFLNAYWTFCLNSITCARLCVKIWFNSATHSHIVIRLFRIRMLISVL